MKRSGEMVIAARHTAPSSCSSSMLNAPCGKAASPARPRRSPSMKRLGDGAAIGVDAIGFDQLPDACLGLAARRHLRPQIAAHEIRQARVGRDDVEYRSDRPASLEQLHGRKAQAFLKNLGDVDGHRARRLAADIVPVGDRGRPGDALTVREDRQRDDHVVEMSDAAIIGIVGDEAVAVADIVQAVQVDDALHRLVEHPDEGRDAGARADQLAVRIGDAGADIQHLVDDRAHRSLLQDREHLVGSGDQAGLDHRCRDRIVQPHRHGQSLHHVDIARQRRQDLRAVLAQDDDVFQPDAEAAGQIDAGLDREHHALLQHRLRGRGDVGRLVAIDAHAVAGAVDEVLAVAGILDDTARRGVDLPCLHAGPGCLQRRLHRLLDDGVDLTIAFRRAADHGHARDVGGEAVLAAADVDDHSVAFLDACGYRCDGAGRRRCRLPRRSRMPASLLPRRSGP